MTNINNNNRPFYVNGENLILGLLFVIAAAGLSFMVESMWITPNSSDYTPTHFSSVTPHKVEQQTVKTALESFPKNLTLSRQHWTIDKFPEVGEVTNFNINNFDESVQYSIDVGNGYFQTVRTNHFQYTYKKAGTYIAALKVVYNEREHILKQKIDVAQPIEILASLGNQ